MTAPLTELNEADTSNWHCPNCGCGFKGDPISQEERELFGNATHFSRLIAIYDQDSDRTVSWLCPECKYEWPR